MWYRDIVHIRLKNRYMRVGSILTAREKLILAALKTKDGRLILKVCKGFLRSPENVDGCANDTLLAVWENISPDRPDNLTAYLRKIARCNTIDKLRYSTAAMCSTELMTELDECLQSRGLDRGRSGKSGVFPRAERVAANAVKEKKHLVHIRAVIIAMAALAVTLTTVTVVATFYDPRATTYKNNVGIPLNII